MHRPIEMIIEDVFTLKGYGIIRSSPENRLIVAIKKGSKLAIGYSDLEVPTTPGEIEMFESMAESEGAKERVFISPARIGKDTLLMLKEKGIEVWDRTAFVLAIGEAALRNAAQGESVEEWEPLDEGADHPQTSDQPEDIDPVAELRRYQREIGPADTEFRITRVDISKRPSRKEAALPKPNASEVRIRPPHPHCGGSLETDIRPPSEDLSQDPPIIEEAMEGEMKINGGDPALEWNDAPSAPVKVSMEEAMEMAPGNISGLELVFRPLIHLSLEYDLKEIGGPAADRRSGSVMIDLVDGAVMDMPPSIMDALSPRSKKDDTVIDPPRIDEALALDRCIGWIKENDRSLERKLHDGMMSTVFAEVEASMENSSLKVMIEKRMLIPVWKGELSIDGSPWIIDAYSGMQRRGR
ncbi:MAG: hypothetical protein QCI82_00175 [Candidatus Thermoplasmatota archaeon]|nr:hypothetical protein [Candidatus Thermoplasmatota archaeon]